MNIPLLEKAYVGIYIGTYVGIYIGAYVETYIGPYIETEVDRLCGWPIGENLVEPI